MEEVIITFVNEELLGGGASVSAGDEIVLDGTIDSLAVTRLVDFLEKTFAVSVPPQDVTIENFRSIATMARFIRERQALETVQ